MFKKVIALLLALAMVACMLVGCASKDTAADTTDKTETRQLTLPRRTPLRLPPIPLIPVIPRKSSS